jgi:hypothetical protein
MSPSGALKRGPGSPGPTGAPCKPRGAGGLRLGKFALLNAAEVPLVSRRDVLRQRVILFHDDVDDPPTAGGRATRVGRGWFPGFVTKQETATTAVASIEDAAECGERADALVSEVLGRVMRQRRSIAAALDYVKSLSRGTRANCWELAEAAGHETPHRMQALLRRYKWSWEKLRALLPGLAAECLPDDPDDLIGPGIAVDETAHLKKGRSTACVSPQHAGVTGKVENCVTWVFTALVTVFGQAWIDFGVYMPECWAKDPPRREKAGIPEDLTFATKPELAAEQIKRLMAAGVRALWAAADEVYGALRRVPGHAAGAVAGLCGHHPVRLPGHPRERQGHPR